ncbi:Mating-type M-specific polypeptide Mc [Apiospora kogelbergensis]|uniref:Mating-type M-specific polypeptide Mc n=1 Tax=Apiospora kogelbergensis TaxID=1337665 RepID=UPI00312E466D
MYQAQPLAHHDKGEDIEQETNGLLLHCDRAIPDYPIYLTPLYHSPIPSTYTKDEEGYLLDGIDRFFDFSSWETGSDHSSQSSPLTSTIEVSPMLPCTQLDTETKAWDEVIFGPPPYLPERSILGDTVSLKKRWDGAAEGASPFDIKAWVQRSTEVRRQEQPQASNGGRVKRPQNAFMLWRKAYRNSIKALHFDRNPKPNFSKVCGELWLLEPAETRMRFKQWAEIEKKNHRTAFPNYVFSTSRSKGAKRGRRRAMCRVAVQTEELTASG